MYLNSMKNVFYSTSFHSLLRTCLWTYIPQGPVELLEPELFIVTCLQLSVVLVSYFKPMNVDLSDVKRLVVINKIY